MATRFVFQKFSSGMSRSTSLLGPHVSSSAARAGAPVTRTAPDCGTRNISNAFHGATLRPGMAVPNNRGIHGYAARSPCSRPAAAETSRPTTGMPSIFMNRATPTSVDSVAGSKRSFSSNEHEKAKMAARGGHDFTPSVWLNSLATWTMVLGLFVMANDN